MPRGAQRESVALAQSQLQCLLIADRKRRKRHENWKTKKNWKTEYKSNAISSHDYVENSYVRLMATHCTACANFPGNSSWEGQGLVNILPLFWIRFFVYFCWYVFCSGPDNPTGRCLRSAGELGKWQKSSGEMIRQSWSKYFLFIDPLGGHDRKSSKAERLDTAV